MNKVLFFLTAILLPSMVVAQTGKVYDNLTVTSKILKSERKFALYLPPDYQSSERSYPVLYLLHGAGDDQTGWVQFGEVLRIADAAIANGTATPMIIVMPDAQTGQRGYFNRLEEDWRYEDFFFEELIPHIEKTYKAKSEKRFRAISGLSMGGGGTLMYAMHRPDMFASACPLSAYVGPLSLEEFKKRFVSEKSKVSDEAVEAYYRKHSALTLAEDIDAKDLNSVRWYIDCGDDDFLFEGNSLLHILLTKKQVKHEYRVRDGGHTWTYWRESLPEVLRFVSDAFHQY